MSLKKNDRLCVKQDVNSESHSTIRGSRFLYFDQLNSLIICFKAIIVGLRINQYAVLSIYSILLPVSANAKVQYPLHVLCPV